MAKAAFKVIHKNIIYMRRTYAITFGKFEN